MTEQSNSGSFLSANLLFQLYHAAELAMRAYTNNRQLVTIYQWEDADRWAEGGVRGELVSDGSTAVVSIAGSSRPEDFVQVLDLPLATLCGLLASRGSIQHARYAVQGVTERFDLTKFDNVFLTGHSLGGCSALLFPLAYQERFGNNPVNFSKIFLFNSPKVLQSHDAARYPYTAAHVRAWSDYAGDIPPWPWKRAHVGQQIWVSRGGVLEGSPPHLHRLARFLHYLSSLLPNLDPKHKTLIAKIKGNHMLTHLLAALSPYASDTTWQPSCYNEEPPCEL